MAVATFQGTIENGRIRLAADVSLPEKTTVYVVVPDFEPTTNATKFDLTEMLSRMPTDYQAQEESFGEPVGKETW
jgi:hypothetical protein